jgi:hypothetical protein
VTHKLSYQEARVSWEALSAISTLVGSVVVTAAAIFAVAQLRETRRSTLAQALIRTFDEIYSPEARNSRAAIYAQAPLADMEMPDAGLARQLDEALAPLDRLQVMIDLGLLPSEIVLDCYGVMIVRLWRSSEAFVTAERMRRGPKYRERAERLYLSALHKHADAVTPGFAL